MASTFAGFLVAGGMGALVNCYISSAVMIPLGLLVQEVFVQPLVALRSLLPAMVGFLGGTLILLVWHFLKTRVVRFLLDYNGWFITPKHPINKLWYVMTIALLGRTTKGAGWYQDYLPSLPVPPLDHTCKMFLASVHPLLTPEECIDTEKAVIEFQSSRRTRLLHLLLRLKGWWSRNWIGEWWLNYIYLRQRTPICFNSNYYTTGTLQPTTTHQLDRAAMLIFGNIMFGKLSREGKMETVMAEGTGVPFCMNGNRYLNNTARIPGKEMDKIAYHADGNHTHILVCRQGRFYLVDVISKDGKVLSPQGIRAQLEKVVNMAGSELDQTGMASLTALPRATWAEIRERLEANPVNAASLHAIDSAWSLVCLDTEAYDVSDLTNSSRHFFHGNGYNRWFDKSSLLIMANGNCGGNVEHSVLDATVAVHQWEYNLSEELYDEEGHVLPSSSYPGAHDFPVDPPTRLEWELAGFEDDLAKAKKNIQDMIADSDLVAVTPGFGKSFPKKCKLSPDGFYQMAMQLAYYRLHKSFVLTYESATTRFYYEGRTETIRPVSDTSVTFVKAMDDQTVPRDQVKKLLKTAIEYQCDYKMKAMRGLGVDRHLLGLYILAKGLDMKPMPKLFEDKAFQLTFKLSTSQTPTHITKRKFKVPNVCPGGGFGTVDKEGYGVSYIIIGEDRVNFFVNSKRSCSETDSTRFGEAICRALWDMKSLYEPAVPHSENFVC
ncbi:hypothetical protein EMCRGX_G002713 [Ephydatia muelleri]